MPASRRAAAALAMLRAGSAAAAISERARSHRREEGGARQERRGIGGEAPARPGRGDDHAGQRRPERTSARLPLSPSSAFAGCSCAVAPRSARRARRRRGRRRPRQPRRPPAGAASSRDVRRPAQQQRRAEALGERNGRRRSRASRAGAACGPPTRRRKQARARPAAAPCAAKTMPRSVTEPVRSAPRKGQRDGDQAIPERGDRATREEQAELRCPLQRPEFHRASSKCAPSAAGLQGRSRADSNALQRDGSSKHSQKQRLQDHGVGAQRQARLRCSAPPPRRHPAQGSRRGPVEIAGSARS